MCIHTHVCAYIRMYVCLYMYVCMYMYVCLFVCLFVCVSLLLLFFVSEFYDDKFFESLDIVVNALDNVDARE